MTHDPNDSEEQLREAVFRQMFASDFSRVVRYVERQLSDHAAAEDVAAEVFRVAWEKLDASDPFRLPWLIRTAMHKTRDYQRRQYRGAAAVDALARFSEEQPATIEHLDRIALYDAMTHLSAKDREIVRLTYWDGLSAGEVAEVLRMREGAIWTRLHRARARLRESLHDSNETGGEK